MAGALYPFGHGLSYTTFEYSNLRVAPGRAGAGASFVVDADVTNSGTRTGEDVVQLYLRDDFTSVVTFDQQLRGFARVHLAPGETKRVSFALGAEAFALWNDRNEWVVEPAKATFWIAPDSAHGVPATVQIRP